ncbi:MAG: hypothetical protein LUQ25_02880 [Methanoregulaceae archaeon]|nr:hypothetical protein [Methanoregulaceae archaeon]
MAGSLIDALGLIRKYPMLCVPGIIFAVLCGLVIAAGDLMFGWKFLIVLLVIEPFFAAGFLGMTKNPGDGIAGFFREGRRYYFRVLLPGLIIGFAIALTILLLALPVSLLGPGALGGILTGAFLGVTVPFVFFTWFYDAAAVFEDRRVFDSIRRSIEVVMQNGWKVFRFFIISLLFAGATGFLLLIVWTATLFDRLEPLTAMNATDLQAFTPAQFEAVLGTSGIWMTVIVAVVWIAIVFTVTYAYKSVFFPAVATLQPEVVIGEYDEKGRWYKY